VTVLEAWNVKPVDEAEDELLPCCGSTAWATRLAEERPYAEEAEFLAASNRVWMGLNEEDWMEAFATHPRIGERHATATAQSLQWSTGEQSAAMRSDEAVKMRLAEANREYETKFGRVFLICAAGRSSDEILAALEKRMGNDAAAEMSNAVEEQRKITQLRLRRWLTGA